MFPDQASVSTQHSSPPQYVVIPHQYREAATFTGGPGDDAQDWLKKYGRVARYNLWSSETILNNVPFYLSGTALTWFENNEAQLSTWDDFKAELLAVFGCGDSKRRTAREKLAVRAQRPDETCAAYIQEVLHLCNQADSSMTEPDKTGHLLKGIAEDVFNFLIQRNVTTVKDFVQECKRFEEVKRNRIAPQYSRLNNVPTVAAVQGTESLSPTLQQLIRQEVQKVLVAMNIGQAPTAPSLEEFVKETVSKCLSLPPTPLPASAFVVERQPPGPGASTYSRATYAMNAAAPDIQVHPHPQVYSQRQWQSRPVCYNCGRPGHTFRTCRSSPESSGTVPPSTSDRHPVRGRQISAEDTIPKRASRDGYRSSPPRFRSPSPTPSLSQRYPYQPQPSPRRQRSSSPLEN